MAWISGLPFVLAACGSAPPPKSETVPSGVAPSPSTAPTAGTAANGAAIGAPNAGANGRPAGAPVTVARPVRETLHGVTLTDDYAWLGGQGDDVDAWVAAQNDHTNRYLQTDPALPRLKARLRAITGGISGGPSSLRATEAGLYGIRRAKGAEQPAIVRYRSEAGASSPETILDPVALDPTGHTAIDWFTVSPDGRYLAVSLSKDGSEDGSLTLFDTTSKKPVGEPIPRVQYPSAGGSAAFTADGKYVLYTRYPAPGERPDAELHRYQTLYRHRLGADVRSDVRVLGDELPDIAEIALQAATAGVVLVQVNDGDGGDKLWFAVRSTAAGVDVKQLARKEDEVKSAVVAPDGSSYVLSLKDAPHGRVLRLPPGETRLAKARVVVPESDRHLVDVQATASSLLVFDVNVGASRLRAFDRAGRLRGEVQVPPHFALWSAGRTGSAALVGGTGYSEPPALYRVDDGSLTLARTAFAATSTTRLDDIEVKMESATSKDGTVVPITLLVPKNVRPGAPAPLLLTAYGGYGISRAPHFSAPRRVLFDHGFIVAIAHVRGGGDLGEPWHQAGKGARKQNVFDDFIASADALVAKGYTARDKLAITGASNGGLLMGAALTQRPDLARAAVIGVPMMDMVHLEAIPNGTFNTTEFGDPKRAEDFRFMLAYSPLQHVRPAAYPAVLTTSGATDGRVPPGDARRFTAHLQAASTSTHPVLLRTWTTAGHGMGTPLSAQSEEIAEVDAFLLRELGVAYREGPAGGP